jgi:hypothetical protein
VSETERAEAASDEVFACGGSSFSGPCMLRDVSAQPPFDELAERLVTWRRNLTVANTFGLLLGLGG